MFCPFCKHEISIEDIKSSKCPYGFPEIRNRDDISVAKDTQFLENEGDEADLNDKEILSHSESNDCVSSETIDVQRIEQIPVLDPQTFSTELEETKARSQVSVVREKQEFPGYVVKGEIGRGGFGSVLLAREMAARRDIALKTFNPIKKRSSIEGIRERFLEEAYITAQLQHPGIIPIYTIAHDTSGRYFYTMRPVEGEDLGSILCRLRKGNKKTEQKYGLRHLMQIMLSVCQTMQFAHERGVIHRDLKPSNIIIGNYGDVMVIDWGLAKVISKPVEITKEEIPDLEGPYAEVWATYQRDLETERTGDSSSFQYTMDGRVIGTPYYMSPEQASGKTKEIGFLSDIWSLGVMLYQCATLKLPFEGMSLERILFKIVTEDPVEPVRANPGRRVPFELANIIMKCLRRNEEDRYVSISELLLSLEQWLEGRAPWRLVEQFDFTTMPDGKPQDLIITAGTWEVRDGMLCGAAYGGLLTAKELPGDVRIEIEAMVLPGEKGEISPLLSAPDPEKSQFFFDGYIMRVISDEKNRAKIHKGRTVIVSTECKFSLDLWHTIAAERTGTTVRLECEGEELLKYRDFFPVVGSRIGLISIGTGLRIRGLRVFTRGTGLTLSCLEQAKAYHDKGMVTEAEECYRQIYSDHADREEGEEALFRSSLISLEKVKCLDRWKEQKQWDEGLKTAYDLFERAEQSFLAPLGVLGKAMVFEQRDEVESEIDELLRTFRDYPDYDTLPVIPEWLRIRLHVWEWDTARASDKLQEGIERILLKFNSTWANQSPLKGVPVDTLDLSESITEIAGLKGLELKILNLSLTKVEDLSPLCGMPLKTLSLPWTICDISSLKDLPLESLDLALTSLNDITALEKQSLKYLSLPTGVSDLSPIRNHPLEHLGMAEVRGHQSVVTKDDIDLGVVSEMPLKVLILPRQLESIPPMHCTSLPFLQVSEKVSDISGLRGLSLRGIDLSGSKVTDLSPLEGMPLEYIGLPSCVSDISVLSGMPLRSLNLFHTAVKYLEPLQKMPKLEYLSIYPDALSSGWEAIVRDLSGLKIVSTDENCTPISSTEFWHMYDRGLLAGSRSELCTLGSSRLEFSNSQGMSFHWIPPGVFLMGSPLSEFGRETGEKQHYVSLNHGFYMAIAPVRVRDFSEFIVESGYVTDAEREGWAYTYRNKEWGRTEGASWRSPGFEQSGDHPVVCVSWYDAQAYIEWLSTKEGRGYRLPTESEWEYSCRAGSLGPYHGDLEQVCWHHYNSDDRTHEVCSKASNTWGLYDMHGNVWEWCSDWYDKYPEGFVVDPIGPEKGLQRVIRGGSWHSLPVDCRSADRSIVPPSYRHAYFSFRLAAADPSGGYR
ncbi:SUMF1/EgtB/PvdO family nonheme iron enzyme [candidate division CSSED10-310 bacterium]|uniref:SUMF1/EgtB/PvdO family nonheme iron enzyme n=1 Tax=candidate division CSSED10-310 bacterium TaxID=2855610 RepID=A0ABV6YRL2_UNCC1